jgi:hypothetical protein
VEGFVGSANTTALVEESSWIEAFITSPTNSSWSEELIDQSSWSEEFMGLVEQSPWSEAFMSPTLTSSTIPGVGARTSEEFKVCNAFSSNYTTSGETWVRFMV